jgi:hypothetical protein
MEKYGNMYSPFQYGDKEVELRRLFVLQRDDSRQYFLNVIKPRLDRSYKLYIAYGGDRQREIKKWQCVSEDTEILSPEGWKKIGQISNGESVFSFNPETKMIEIDTAQDEFSYDFDGEMISIKQSNTDQLLTGNHRVLLKKGKKVKKTIINILKADQREHIWDDNFQYVQSCDLLDSGSVYQLPLSGSYDGELSTGSGDWAELIGWFLTDGCFPKNSKQAYITQSKPETLIRLRNLIISLGVEYREWSRKKEMDHYHDEHRFYFPSNGDVVKKMLEWVPDRKPNNLLWKLTLSEKRRLLDGICFGDGSLRPDGKYHMVTKPKKDFLEWLQVLVHLVGMRSVITDKYANIAYSNSVCVQGKKNIRKVAYKGKVWSISTRNTNYIAKRNGLIFITGNSNVQIPYIQSAVETMVPRIVDARPEFTVVGRNQDDQAKAEKQVKLMDYNWERANMDRTNEDFVRSTLIYGTGFLQVSWKKDVRKLKFLRSKDITSKKYEWKQEERVFFDGPMCEWVDNYNLWYDWHNTARQSKQYWLKRLVLTRAELVRRYPMADKKRLQLALEAPGGDLTDYAAIRQRVRTTNIYTTKSSAATAGFAGQIAEYDKYRNTQDVTVKMYEVYEWWRPFDDAYAVMVGGSYVPIFKDGVMPIPMDFKEAPFIEAAYLKIPGEFEGYGLPMILESPQIMLNLVKNQRLDAATLSIHKMWIVNPLANVNKDELVTRPFGIIYSVDPNGVREIQFSDIKPSAYKEEELLKGDMQYASGVDDFSQGVGGGSSSATEVRHLRESTLERVRMFVNHLGDAYSDVLRYWMDMSRQLFSEQMTIRIIGKNGQPEFPLIEKDDLNGYFDYKAKVLPSIAGDGEVKKKQDMDLYQLLINLPFVDPQKLTSRVISDWGWSLDGVTKDETTTPDAPVGPDGQPSASGLAPSAGAGMPPAGIPMMPPAPPAPISGMGGPGYSMIPKSSLRNVTKHLRRTGENYGSEVSPYGQMANPVNLLNNMGIPPTPKGVQAQDKSTWSSNIPNIAGHNRATGGRVDTNIPSSKPSSVSSNILNQALSLQNRKK